MCFRRFEKRFAEQFFMCSLICINFDVYQFLCYGKFFIIYQLYLYGSFTKTLFGVASKRVVYFEGVYRSTQNFSKLTCFLKVHSPKQVLPSQLERDKIIL